MCALSIGLSATQALAEPRPVQVSEPAIKQTRTERAEARKAARQARRRARAARADAPPPPRPDGASVAFVDEIVVTGIRRSVKESIDRKRRARQIVDVVTSEDAGKLPDNNVVEALARVTGVAVTRSQGRANGYTIRGLAGVQTTVNGVESSTAPLPGGEGRTLALESIPAELVKSIEVYKSRTADQIEGGIGGSVNVELRRPLDLPKGWTVAGGVKNKYSEIGKLSSPSVDLLVAKRFDTGIGEMGFLINGAYSKPRYQEAFSYSESPDLVGCPVCTIRLSLPPGQRDTLVAPYRAAYGESAGEREQKSLSAAIQWRASSKLSFVLEGSYFGEKSRDDFNSLFVRTREDYYTLQNIRVSPSGGALLGYDIVNLPAADGTIANFGKIDAGFTGGENRGNANTYRTNFEAHFESTGLKIDASSQYQWSNNSYYGNSHVGTYLGLNTARVEFDSPKVQGNGPFFSFNVAPTDPALARIESLSDNIGSGHNTLFSAQVDVWKELDPTGFLRDAKFGGRFTRNTYGYNSSYRYAAWFDPAQQPLLSAIPGVGTVSITPDLPGGSPLSWVQLNSKQLYDNWPAVTKFIVANNPEFLDGIGQNNGVASLFSTDRPNADDIVYSSDSTETTFAAYATVNYEFKAVFPIDGNFGLRYVNTYSTIDGRNVRPGAPILSGGRPTGQFGPDVVENTSVRGNYVDILPSAFVNVHFTKKLQLRGSYSYNVQRPGLFDLRNFRQIDYRKAGSPVYAGNPKLIPTTTNDYNLALEWYFGQGGIISLAAFSKNQNGFIYYTRQQEFVPELGDTRDVFKPRNAGPGQTQGLEFQATSFFTFLPGFLRHFGATANATWIPTANLSLPVESAVQPANGPVAYDLVTRRAPYTSRWSYNLIGYYETPKFSARLAYNWRSEYQTAIDAVNQSYIISSQATSRLDGAINFTPVKFLTLNLEASNLLNSTDKNFYFTNPDLPNGLLAMGRTITAGARFRF